MHDATFSILAIKERWPQEKNQASTDIELKDGRNLRRIRLFHVEKNKIG